MYSRNRLQKAAADCTRFGADFLARLRQDQAGNTLAIVAASLVPVAGIIGSGLDMSRVYMAQSKLQNACDSAVLAGRRKMSGITWTSAVEDEADRFFDFNFPSGTMEAENLSFDVEQDSDDLAQINGEASANIPTTIMQMFGKETMPIEVECNAKHDYANLDIMLVLDVTGSMNCAPGIPGGCGGIESIGSKASRLRTGANSLYTALEGLNTRVRYGMMPYSGTVNVAAHLRNRDILRRQTFQKSNYVCTFSWRGTCYAGYYEYSSELVRLQDTAWWNANGASGMNQSIANWRTNGSGCIEERPTIGNAANPVEVYTSVAQADIDAIAANDNDDQRQWGRYDPAEEEGENQTACPARAVKLQEFASETTYSNAINSATANLTGGTFHDVGMLWGARFLSSSGMFAAENPTILNDIPVRKHIIFMTDGMMDTATNPNYYSSYGLPSAETRIFDDDGNTGDSDTLHVAHFQAVCNRAKAMGMTIWVIAVDVGSTSDIEPCATDTGHFYTSDGTDLDEVFSQIGRAIGELRLTK